MQAYKIFYPKYFGDLDSLNLATYLLWADEDGAPEGNRHCWVLVNEYSDNGYPDQDLLCSQNVETVHMNADNFCVMYLVDVVLLDNVVEEAVEVVEERHHLHRGADGAHGGEAHNVREEDGH